MNYLGVRALFIKYKTLKIGVLDKMFPLLLSKDRPQKVEKSLTFFKWEKYE